MAVSAAVDAGLDPVPVVRPGAAPVLPPRPAGLVLSPFRALRYAVPDEQLPAHTCPPYDVVDAAGRSACEQLSPTNVVRLILPRPGSASRSGSADPDRYRRAAALLQHWRAAGVLVRDPEPALYAYEQAPVGAPALRGLIGAAQLSPPEAGVVLPHEDVMPGPVADRQALHTAVRGDLEPVLLAADLGRGAVAEALAALPEDGALMDTRTPAGRHRLWALTDPALLEAVAAELEQHRAVILDGHHRWASHLARQADARARGAGAGPWDAGLALLVDTGHPGLQVEAVHRVLPGQDPAALADAAGGHMHVLDGRALEEALPALEQAGASGPALLLADGSASVLRLVSDLDPRAVQASLPAERSPAWRSLDVAVLHAHLVARVWGIRDDPEHVQHAHGAAAALAGAAATAGAAVLLNPPSASSVLAVAAAGDRMPRKSTSFGPKPLSGLLLRTYDDDD